MAITVGILCPRVRVEEKAILSAVSASGADGVAIHPTTQPLPAPASRADWDAWFAASAIAGEVAGTPQVVIDRVPERHVGALLATSDHRGIRIDAGIAARRNRIACLSVLADADIPRPKTMLALAETVGQDAARQLGYPCTLFPVGFEARSTTLLDDDTSDAVIEHRSVLGKHIDAMMILQQGALGTDDQWYVHVLNGRVVGYRGAAPVDEVIALSERVSAALRARFITLSFLRQGSDIRLWNIAPVADFRQDSPWRCESIAEAIATDAVELANAMTARRDRAPSSVSA